MEDESTGMTLKMSIVGEYPVIPFYETESSYS